MGIVQMLQDLMQLGPDLCRVVVCGVMASVIKMFIGAPWTDAKPKLQIVVIMADVYYSFLE